MMSIYSPLLSPPLLPLHLCTPDVASEECTLRLWSIVFEDALGDWYRVNSQVQMEAAIEWDERCPWRPTSRECRDAVGSHDWACLEMHLGAKIEWTQRCTWKPYISKMYFGHWEPLGVSESSRTRIPGLTNPRVFWTDAVAFRCTWKHLGAPTTSLGAHQITVEESGKTSSSLGTLRCAWKSLLLLIVQWFLKLINSVCILIYVSMYLYSYPSTHSISGVVAGGAWEQFEVRLKMMNMCTQIFTLRPWSTEVGDALGGHDRASLEMHLVAMIQWCWWYTWRSW